MTGHQIAIVFDANLTFDGRCGQVTNLRNDRTGQANQTAQQQYIYVSNGMCLIDPYAIQQAQHNRSDDAAYRTFDGFLRAQGRTKLVFPQKITCEISPCITAKSRNKCQPDHQFPVVIFSDQIYMGKQEADINQLKVRLRGGKSKKQMVLSFNPINIQHWIKKHFIDSGLATVCFSTYKDNKFLTDDDRAALEQLKQIDEYTYNVYCLGQWGILGKTVFDARAIQKRLTELKKPIRTGYFEYEYDGLAITNIKWISDKNGYIKLYDVPRLTEYCIGGDTAGEGSDYFTGHVLDAKTGVQVAHLRHQFDADLYTRQMYCLGRYYKDALIGIEANFDSYPIRELQRLGYPRQYTREAQDTYTGKTEKRYGFKTTSLTRPTIISRLIEIVREHCDTINDKDTLEELLTIVRNERGRIEAPEGGHDDDMMGLAIAHEIRTQVVFAQEPIIVNPQYRFDVERMMQPQQDYGEQMTVV